MEPTQLFAQIRKRSKYFGQNALYETLPFPVTIVGSLGDYGILSEKDRYCLYDVNLFVEIYGVMKKLC